ncbi:MAG: class I SAM-dependent methyltransferase [Gaiellaceae bacterium]
MSSSDLTGQARTNREFWNAQADRYQREHTEFISHDEPHWGMWQLPDSELGVLGEVSGLDVFELGCGAGQFGIVLARKRARVVGLDNSERQLEHARRNAEAAGVDMELHHGSAESLPFEDRSFDLVVADHGANRFADPYLWVPESARVLRPGGALAFCGGTAFEIVCLHDQTDTWDATLHRPYFGLHKRVFDDQDGVVVEFELGYGDWIRLFRRSELEVEALIEVQPPEGATSTYRTDEETAWARRWPMEQIWKVRKP